MLCQNCGKNEANIRYTQIINGVKKEVALCSDCAVKLGIGNIAKSFDTPDFPINFKSFLGDFFNDYQENELMPNFTNEITKCKTCGMTYDDFIDSGMFGCEDCYDTFSGPIDSLLKNLHGTSRHIGRGPGSKASKIKIESDDKEEKKEKEKANKPEDKKTELQRELDKAIKEERYEDAAKLRDQIKALDKDSNK